MSGEWRAANERPGVIDTHFIVARSLMQQAAALDQPWCLRLLQQVRAFEFDLLKYDDIFDGSKVIEAKTAELEEAAGAELQWALDGGGAFEMTDAMKGRLVQSHAERVRRIESGDLEVVGVNAFTETAASPLVTDDVDHILVVDPAAEADQVARSVRI